MTVNNVKNSTLNSSTSEEIKAPQTEPATAGSLLKAAKAAIKALTAAEARSRKAMAEMVSTFVEMGYAYLNDQQVTAAIDAECKEHGINPVDINTVDAGSPAPNVFLPMMSIVDGKWSDVHSAMTGKPVKDKKTGKTKQKWARNRSFEKYASVIRFFIHNEISHLEVVEILTSDEPIKIEGFENGVKPRIMDIVRADTEQQNGKRRAPQVWTVEAKAAVAIMKPIMVVPLSEAVAKTFTLSDGYIAPVARVVNGELHILFDSGLNGDALYKVINKRTAALAEALKAEIEQKKAA